MFKPRPKCNYSKTKYIFQKKYRIFKEIQLSCIILRLFPFMVLMKITSFISKFTRLSKAQKNFIKKWKSA